MPVSPDSDSTDDAPAPITDVLERLGSYADLCAAVPLALQADDASRKCDLAWTLRAARAELDVEALRARIDAANEGDAAIWRSRFEDLRERARPGEEALRAWASAQRPERVDTSWDDPETADRWIESGIPPVWDPERDVVILFGLALRTWVERLRARGQKRILFVLTRREARSTSESELGAKIVERHDEQIIHLAPWVRKPPMRFAWFREPSIDADLAARAVDRIKHQLPELRLWRNTIEKHGTTIIEQALENLPAILRYPCVDRLERAFVDVPMVIVAPGPSLEKNLESVRSFRGHAVVVALSHTLKAMATAGIEADIVIAIDMLDQTEYFQGVSCERSTLVLAAGAHPRVIGLPARHLAICSAGASFDAWPFHAVGEQPFLSNGGTVAGAALSLGLLMGCDPIVFAGLDLAFSEGRFYASTVSGGSRAVTLGADKKTLEIRMARANGTPDPRVRMTANALTLPGYYGGEVLTSPQFHVFHDWFQRQAAKLRGRPQLLNCTEGGSFIRGMDHLPLAEAARLHTTRTIDVGAVLDGRLGGPPADARATTIADKTETMQRQVEAFLRMVVKGQKHAARVIRNPVDADYHRFLKAHPPLIDAWNALPFLPVLHQVDFVEEIERIKGAATERDQAAAALRLYAAAERGARWLGARLNQASRKRRPHPHAKRSRAA